MKELYEKVRACAEGAAMATGCTVEIKKDYPDNSAVRTNKPMIDLYVKNAESLGVLFNDGAMATKLMASTDMGNVSQLKPSIHPLFRIKTDGPNHTYEFTNAAIHSDNQVPTLNAAKSMAMTAIDVICNPELMNDIRDNFLNPS